LRSGRSTTTWRSKRPGRSRVDLVHEDDAGRVLLGLLEEVADAAGADTDEHLDEV
jgi:hypothetical protein